ncbi:MAG: hypothetical protein MUE44_18555 [Oscillatoriaceae cyanobacterium Prado104]|jgi:DNA modification methylase|nr:hypothetical protein [Oscillatoriaceae cyanobacterium Prado104]
MNSTDLIAEILGKPYFQAPNCLIYNMDCLAAMRWLPDRFVDLTVTSPPYNIGKEYERSFMFSIIYQLPRSQASKRVVKNKK